MRVLLIKTSSMGDILHTLPALTDAGKAIPAISFDWVIEEAFAEIPSWHPLVKNVIPISLRRWRKGLFSKETRADFKAFRQRLREEKYDLVLDAQGLVKSAFLTLFAKGERVGLDWPSAREAIASLFYKRKCKVNFYQHAIHRMRSLFSKALGYEMPACAPFFGLEPATLKKDVKDKYLVFLHGTTWETKLWPEAYWIALGELAKASGYKIKMSGGNPVEVERANRMAKACDAIEVKAYLTISQMAEWLANASGAVAVDTGFGHLSAALNIPTVSLYGATNANFTGALGNSSFHLSADFACSPCLRRTCDFRGKSEVSPACYEALTPMLVFSELKKLMA